MKNTPSISSTSKDAAAGLLKDNNRKKWVYLLLGMGLLSLLSLIYLVLSLSKVTGYVGGVNQLEMHSSNIVRHVNEAVFSDTAQDTQQARQQLQQDINGYDTALKKAMDDAIDHNNVFDDLQSRWQDVKPTANQLLEDTAAIEELNRLSGQIATNTRNIQQLYTRAITQAVSSGLDADQISTMQTQSIRAEKIASAFAQLNRGDTNASTQLSELVEEFTQALNSQRQAHANNVPALNEINTLFNRNVLPAIESNDEANVPAITLRDQARNLSDFATDTQQALQPIDRDILSRSHILIPAFLFLIGMLGCLYALYRLYKTGKVAQQLLIEKETRRQRDEMEAEYERRQALQEENERNQTAILRLMDELGDVAEGDLTVNATVTEDITGAIADSVNYAIDQLRELALAINKTSTQVAASSEQTQQNAVQLAESSEKQSQQITEVSTAINEMVRSIEQVSSNAAQSTTVAERSVEIAHNGAEVVQRSIEGMNSIRGQIQETSKRIKRLGESSQEIGDIVSLINDIADQTNVLALNAAIQASMAGEAGRGFAVVADEVQRLAERSANATKQIETLVKTIQADTNEAVMSMESTTNEVVLGAKLAKDAGEALQEVQSVSNNLADLIQNISNEAKMQASSAGQISETMQIIQNITSETTSGTRATARSVGELNEMAASLQQSVSGFKLD